MAFAGNDSSQCHGPRSIPAVSSCAAGILVKESTDAAFSVPPLFAYTLRQVNLEKGNGPVAVYLSTSNLDGTPITVRLATLSASNGMQDKVRIGSGPGFPWLQD